MDKMDMKTPNIADRNFEILSKMFPNAITETINENGEVVRSIDVDVLRQEISCSVVEGKEERYQFTWPDKKKAIVTANAPVNFTLRPCYDESLLFDTTKNLYIEGDNLDTLKMLQETYLGKIKMIYIDPPYNTGGDFIYNDDFAENAADYIARSGQLDEDGNRMVQNTESNGRFHTDWLNMIYPRIKLAKNLLAEDGVIFISIDENEITNLKVVCNEIFGEENLVTVIHVEMSATQGMKVKAAQNGNIVKNAEYILVYSKDGHKNIANTVLYDYRPVYDGHYSKMVIDGELRNLKDEFLKKHPEEIISNVSDGYSENKLFREYVNMNIDCIFADDKISGYDTKDYPEGKVYHVNGAERSYYIYNNGKKIRQLLPLAASYGQCDDFDKSFGLRKIRGDWWKDFYKDMGNVSKEGNVVFANGKKPVRLIKQLCKMCTSEDDIIMDFFAGSATTAQAVMELNSEDGGHRKYILLQLPEIIDGEKTICDLALTRIKNVGDIYKEKGVDVGVRVLKKDSSNMKDIYYNPADLHQTSLFEMANNIKEDRTPEDLLFQIMLDLGVVLSSKIEKKEIADREIYNVADGFLIACFDENVTEDVVKEIAKMKPYYAVFRDSSMASDSVATNFDQIFASISPDTVRKVL